MYGWFSWGPFIFLNSIQFGIVTSSTTIRSYLSTMDNFQFDNKRNIKKVFRWRLESLAIFPALSCWFLYFVNLPSFVLQTFNTKITFSWGAGWDYGWGDGWGVGRGDGWSDGWGAGWGGGCRWGKVKCGMTTVIKKVKSDPAIIS